MPTAGANRRKARIHSELVMSISPHNSSGYGPLGTPDAGRTQRIASYDREAGRRYRAAAEGIDGGKESDLRNLREEVRCLRDQIEELRRELTRQRSQFAARVESEVVHVLANQLPEAVGYLIANREALHNGKVPQSTHR